MKTVSFRTRLGVHALNVALLSGTMFSTPAGAQEALPTGGQVVSGSATISTSGPTMTINQASDRMVANWQGFNIGADNAVTFNQPNAQSVALNRVIGQDPSQILGKLTANGQIFLLNPNGIVIGKQGQVQTGGFVGSTLGLTDADFQNGNYRFTGTGGSILNQGDLKGGVVALIAPRVQNEGTITGNTALAAGTDVTLDFDGDGLLSVEVSTSTLGTLVENGGLIKADGGVAILTARGANDAFKGVVNNTGTVEAASLQNRDGRILLLGDMNNGEVNAGGTLTASFVETSAKRVNIADGLAVRTNGGEWLIDPNDFTIASSGGNITGTALSNNLANGSVTISTASQGTAGGNGDIFVNDGVTWSANTLTLNADRNININTAMNASGTAGLALQYAQTDAAGDYYVNAPVNLASTGSFSTKMGANAAINFTIITSLGAAGSTTGTDLQGINGNLSGNYVLGSDIDASTTANWNGGSGFAPIGDNSSRSLATRFSGYFDGLGHSIGSLTINRPSASWVGLFGIVENAEVSNISIMSANITGFDVVGVLSGNIESSSAINVRTSGSVSGRNAVGGMVAQVIASDVIDSRSSTQVASSGRLAGGLAAALLSSSTRQGKITNSSSSGFVSGGDEVGGLVGSVSNGIVSNSYSTGSVLGRDSVGGLIGVSGPGDVQDSYATGTVDGRLDVGGLIGVGAGVISNSYATGNVAGNRAGGLIGTGGGLTITESFATGDVTAADVVITNAGQTSLGSARAGGLVAEGSYLTIVDSYATGDVVVNGDSSVVHFSGYHGAGGIAAGGLVGVLWNNSDISNSYASGQVTNLGGNARIGGLVGQNHVESASDLATTTNRVSNSFFDSQATGQGGACGFVGSLSSCNATGLTTAQMKDSANFTAAGWDFTTVWAIDPAINNGYPYLRATVAAPVVTPPPPPPPPAPVVLAVNDFGSSFATSSAPYQPPIALTGSGLAGVTEVRFTWTDPNGQTGTVTWNAANSFGGGRFVVGAGGTTATLSPVLVAAGDPSGTYQWTVTFVAGSQTVTRNFAVTYTAVVVPPPPPPPPAPLSLTSGISDYSYGGVTPYRLPISLSGQGLNNVTAVTLSWIDPTGAMGTVTWDAGDNFRGGRFSPSASGTSATITPTLLAAGDPPGLYQWTVTLTNGSQTVTDRFNVTYAAAALEEPVVQGSIPNPTSGLGLGAANAAPLYVSTSAYLGGEVTRLLAAVAASNIRPELQALIRETVTAYGGTDNFGIISQNVPYAMLANAVYGNDNPTVAGWTNINSEFPFLTSNDEVSFNASVFRNNKTGEIVIAYRGSDSRMDWQYTNSSGGADQKPMAMSLYNAVFAKYRRATLTGHSLGGGLAEYIAAATGARAVVFDPAPFSSSEGLQSGSFRNIVSFRNRVDPLTAIFGVLNLVDPITIKNSSAIPFTSVNNFKSNHSMSNLLIAMQAVDLVNSELISQGLIK